MKQKPEPWPVGRFQRLAARLPWPPGAMLLAAGVGVPLASVLLAPGIYGRRSSTADQPYVASGYNEVVNTIFGKFGWLVRNEQDPDTPSEEGKPIVTLADRAWNIPEVRSFMQNSFLRADIDANDPARWVFDGDNVVGINPWIHNRAGSLAASRDWKGVLQFRSDVRNEADIGIEGGGHRLMLTPASANRRIEWTVSTDGVTLSPGEARHGLEFVYDGASVATLRRVGDSVLIRGWPNAGMMARVEGPTGLIAGASLEDGSREYRLAPGMSLVFQRLGNEHTEPTRFRLAGTTLMSGYRVFGRRQFDETAETIARPLVDALSKAVSDRQLSSDNDLIVLTLDRAIQADAQELLGLECEQLLGLEVPQGKIQKRFGNVDVPFRAAITVMDASNGDLLALGTFPTAMSRAPKSIRYSPAWMVQNQNFVALPIGSMAKVPFSAAILQRFPDLATLKAPGGIWVGDKLQFGSVAGVPLSAPIRDTHGGVGISFRNFLTISSNRYAATLLVLAAAEQNPLDEDGHPVPVEDAYELAGKPRPHAPRMALCTASVRVRCTPQINLVNFPTYLAQPTWTHGFKTLFDMPEAVSSGQDIGFDYSLWRPLLGDGWDDQQFRAFSTVSPELEHFRLDRIENIRNDYVSLILGGGRSRWTTIKLAETYARVVTGQKIRANLWADSSVPGAIDAAGFSSLARTEVMAGMRGVLDKGGTAFGRVQLGIQPRAGESYCAFAKTGTPTLSNPERTPLNKDIRALIRAHVLGMHDNRLALLSVPPGESDVEALQRIITRFQVSMPGGSTLRQLMKGVGDINRHRRIDGKDGLSFDTHGRLIGLAADLDNLDADRGSGFTIVLGRFRGVCEAGVPVRVLSVSINIQSRFHVGDETGENRAIDVMEALMRADGPLRQWLESDPPARAGAAR